MQLWVNRKNGSILIWKPIQKVYRSRDLRGLFVNKEIGGYIEIEYNHGGMLHENAVHLNCGRRALSYIIRSKDIKKIWIPKLTCRSVIEPFKTEGCEVGFYSVGSDFLPQLDRIPNEDWIVLINYYGQISNEQIQDIATKHSKLIVDNTQAYFQMPVDGLDTVYSCRKFFGVADGAILYTSDLLIDEIKVDESFERMTFLMGRFERTASEFYEMYARNNDLFENEPIKKMSKLTKNILCGINYEFVSTVRLKNFRYLDDHLKDINRLNLVTPDGAFMYPLYIENGKKIRKQLQDKKIYIPTLWPDVYDICLEKEIEYDMAANILPIPVDQRYRIEDMRYIAKEIFKLL